METKNSQSQQELSLLDFLSLVWSALVRMCCALTHFIVDVCALCYRKWWVVFSIAVLVLAGALYFNRHNNRCYDVSALVVLNGPELELVEQAYHEIAQASAVNDTLQQNMLSSLLGIDIADARALRKFRSHKLLSNQLNGRWVDYKNYAIHADRKDTTTSVVNNVLELSFQTKRPGRIVVVEEAIMNYLNCKPTLLARYEAYRNYLETELRFQEQQIALLDSVSRAFYAAQINARPTYSQSGNNIMVGRQEITLMNQDISAVYRRVNQLQQALSLCETPVVIENHFVAKAVPVHHPIFYPAKMFVVGIMLGLLLAYYVENRKRWLSLLKK